MKPELYRDKPTFHAPSQLAWRNWLSKNATTHKNVWLIIYKKQSGIPSVYYSEAVDEALCFGWIDSLPNKRDDKSYYLFFSPRKPKSNWSKVNKAKIKKLIAANKMTSAGMSMVELAKKTGTWTALDKVEALVVPDDLKNMLNENSAAKKYFQLFPPSARKAILDWIQNAKQPETRLKRIVQTVELAAKNERANQYKKKT